VALWLILLAGLALRLYRLGADSLWYDETVSTALAGSALPELIRHTAGDIHPPLYYILLRGWLVVMGYPTGHADATGIGLEFAAGFFSLFFGVLLIGLIYALARRLAGPRAALIAAALAAFSPYNIWYSQEVRMYTLGAVFGVVVALALAQIANRKSQITNHNSHIVDRTSHIAHRKWWAIYAVAAAAGMYTLYYFAFLLIPLNLWMLARSRRPSRLTFDVSRLPPLLLANLAAVLLYAPWLPIAFRQATDPPVPPWRSAPALLASIMESVNALALGQSAPGWAWPVAALVLGVYALGLVAMNQRITNHESRIRHSPFAIRHSLILPVATFGPLALILGVSLVTPLYHVRYLFTYSPAFYVVVGAGLAWLWARRRLAAGLVAGGWLAAAAITLAAFWFDPLYRPDDHRAAVRALQARWRPGDVLLVNAGYAYPPLLTYWPGPIAGRVRLTDPLPPARPDDALVIVMAGHLADTLPAGTRLGWGDPRSDFFTLSGEDAAGQLDALFQTFGRVWHYRIYDTVNDPAGTLRARLAERGALFEELPFPGEANMRVQGFMPRAGVAWSSALPAARYANGVRVQFDAAPVTVQAGQALFGRLTWRADAPPSAAFGVSLRLVGGDGATWAQPTDERPFGPLLRPPQWPAGLPQRQPFRVPIPPGTPPGVYTLALLVYDSVSGIPLPPQDTLARPPATPGGLDLMEVTVTRGETSLLPARAHFGPLALIEATSPATVLSPGGQAPVELLWQALRPPSETLVVVVQLLGAGDLLIANLEEQPVQGRHPTTVWTTNELVRDRHTLQLPEGIPPGDYRLIVGVYRAADLVRLKTPVWPFGESDTWVIKRLTIR
jgi:4-amino-4-deoxy-L-arabinose transferase-like glycosyltransferase